MEKNNSLNHFCNLGYQTFLNSQEEMDLLNKFNFEFHRLGEITDNIKIIEPILSEANLLTVDFKSIKASELNSDVILKNTLQWKPKISTIITFNILFLLILS